MKIKLHNPVQKLLIAAFISISSNFVMGQTGYFGAYALDSAIVGSLVVNYTTIDNPGLNSFGLAMPDAVFLETANWGANGGTIAIYNNNITGVWNTEINWAVMNEDDALMPLDAGFNILIPSANGTAFSDTNATVSSNNYFDIDNAATNGNPGALVFVTHNFGTSSGPTAVDDSSATGVWYDGNTSKWSILNERTANIMKADLAFNVFVADTGGGRAFIQVADTPNVVGYYTIISNPLTDNNPNAVLIIEHNYTASGGLYETVPLGVWYTGSNWAIFHEDTSAMQPGQAYNVLVASAPVETGIAYTAVNNRQFKVYPNPASGDVTISYTLAETSNISIELYSVDGRKVATVFEGREVSGSYTMQQNTAAFAAGSYYFVLSTSESRTQYPMMVVR